MSTFCGVIPLRCSFCSSLLFTSSRVDHFPSSPRASNAVIRFSFCFDRPLNGSMTGDRDKPYHAVWSRREGCGYSSYQFSSRSCSTLEAGRCCLDEGCCLKFHVPRTNCRKPCAGISPRVKICILQRRHHWFSRYETDTVRFKESLLEVVTVFARQVSNDELDILGKTDLQAAANFLMSAIDWTGATWMEVLQNAPEGPILQIIFLLTIHACCPTVSETLRCLK